MKLICNVAGSFELLESITKTILRDKIGSIIDVCCGEAHIIKNLNQFSDRVAVDVIDRFPKDVKDVKFYNVDVLKHHYIFDRVYSVAICYDAIEHFSKDNGKFLLELLEYVSKTNIFFTPIQGNCDTDMDYTSQKDGHNIKESCGVDFPDCHKSGWLPHEFKHTDYYVLEFPNWHNEIKAGAFLFWRSPDIVSEFERVVRLLKPYGVTITT